MRLGFGKNIYPHPTKKTSDVREQSSSVGVCYHPWLHLFPCSPRFILGALETLLSVVDYALAWRYSMLDIVS